MPNPVETMMEQKLRTAFAPSELIIENDSHRSVYAVLAEALAGPIHALALRLKAPSEG